MCVINMNLIYAYVHLYVDTHLLDCNTKCVYCCEFWCNTVLRYWSQEMEEMAKGKLFYKEHMSY